MKITNRVLHLEAKPVDFKYPMKNKKMVGQMVKLMQRENGIGLSATQVGLRHRLFVMQIDGRDWECFNPELLETSEHWVNFDEGCLSFPGDRCIIQRPEQIKVKYQNYCGEWSEETLSGLASRYFQHELDHLHGITMWDRYKEQHAIQSRN